MFTNHQHARKIFCGFYFRDKVTMTDHTPYKWWPTVCIFNVETIVRLSKSVAVSEKLPCQREGPNSEDLFAVAASWSYIGREKFPLFARCFYDKTGQPSVDILDLRLEGTVFDLLSAKNLWRKKIFAATNFRGLVIDRENRENFSLAKLSRYTVYQSA